MELECYTSVKDSWLIIWVCINTKACVDILYLTPWSRVLEKLTVPELFETLPAFYGARRLITMFTRIRYFSLFWSKWIQSTPSYINRMYFNYSFPLRLVLPGVSFLCISPRHFCVHFSSTCTYHVPHLLYSPWFDHFNILWGVQI
jgi:hypothetical protein